MQAMLLSLEEPSRAEAAYEHWPDVSGGAAGSTARSAAGSVAGNTAGGIAGGTAGYTAPSSAIAAAAQRAHAQSVDPHLIATVAADLGSALTAGLEAQARATGTTNSQQAALEHPWGSAATSAARGGHLEDQAALEYDSSGSGSSSSGGGGGGNGRSHTRTHHHYHAYASRQPCQPVSKDGSQLVPQGRMVTATVSPVQGDPSQPGAAAKLQRQPVSQDGSQLAPQGRTVTATVSQGRGDPLQPEAAAKLPRKGAGATSSRVTTRQNTGPNDVFSRYTRRTSLPTNSCDDSTVGEEQLERKSGLRPKCQPGSPAAMHATGERLWCTVRLAH